MISHENSNNLSLKVFVFCSDIFAGNRKLASHELNVHEEPGVLRGHVTGSSPASLPLEMILSEEREKTKADWTIICESYNVPKNLYQQQIDTITLLLKGQHIFCGSPTGSGKTLAQLCTVLFTSGLSSPVV